MSPKKRLLVTAVILPFAFFYLNAAVAALTPGPEEAALKQAVAQGWKREELSFTRSRYLSGGFGLNRQGSVWFEMKGSNPPRFVRVDVHRPHSFVTWRIDRVTEEGTSQS